MIKGDKGPPTAAVVPVATAWVSKINWAQLISFIAIIAAIWNIQISSELQANLVVGILAFAGLVDVLTAVARTWFTKSVTPQSVSDAVVLSPANTPVPPAALMSLEVPRVVDARHPPDTIGA